MASHILHAATDGVKHPIVDDPRWRNDQQASVCLWPAADNMTTMLVAAISDSIAQWATAVGAGFVAFQLRQTQRSLRATFEQTFVERYERIVAAIPLSALLEGKAPTRAADPAEAVDRAFFDYFELCEEELYYRRLGRVSARTWTDWWEGIALNLRTDAFGEALGRLAERSSEDRDDERKRPTRFVLTRQALEAARGHQLFDPVSGWWRRRAF